MSDWRFWRTRYRVVQGFMGEISPETYSIQEKRWPFGKWQHVLLSWGDTPEEAMETQSFREKPPIKVVSSEFIFP